MDDEQHSALRVEVSPREPDEAFVQRLAALAREGAAGRGPARRQRYAVRLGAAAAGIGLTVGGVGLVAAQTGHLDLPGPWGQLRTPEPAPPAPDPLEPGPAPAPEPTSAATRDGGGSRAGGSPTPSPRASAPGDGARGKANGRANGQGRPAAPGSRRSGQPSATPSSAPVVPGPRKPPPGRTGTPGGVGQRSQPRDGGQAQGQAQGQGQGPRTEPGQTGGRNAEQGGAPVRQGQPQGPAQERQGRVRQERTEHQQAPLGSGGAGGRSDGTG